MRYGSVLAGSVPTTAIVQSALPEDLQARVTAALGALPPNDLVVAMTLAGAGDGHTFTVTIETADAAFVDGGLDPVAVRCYMASEREALAAAEAAAKATAPVAPFADGQVAGAPQGSRFMGMLVYGVVAGSSPGGPAGGDLAGTYPDPEVVAIHTGATQLAIGAIADGSFLRRVGATIVGQALSLAFVLTLGNTTGPTSIVVSSGAEIVGDTGVTTVVRGGPGVGVGGGAQLVGGAGGTGAGGAALVEGGPATALGAAGGTATLQGGLPVNGNGGAATVQGRAAASTTGAPRVGGAASLLGGAGANAGAGGNAVMTAGAGGPTGPGGNVIITGGLRNAASGGDVTMQGANAGVANTRGGNVLVRGGVPIDGAGGDVTIQGGDAAGTDRPGGTVTILGGAGVGFGATGGGAVILTGGGKSSNVADSRVIISGGSATVGGGVHGADVLVRGGAPIDGNGGSIKLNPANAVGTNRIGGDIEATLGTGTGTGRHGNMAIGTVPASYGGLGRGIFLANSLTQPTSNPVGGLFLYSNAGNPEWRTSGGTRVQWDGSAATASAGAGVLPASPQEFLVILLNGLTRKIPLYLA